MPYYAGDYYQGDNYQAGGLLSSIGKFVGKVAGGLVRLSPAGAVATTVGRALIPSFHLPMAGPGGGGMQAPEPGVTGAIHRMAPGGHPGYGRYTKGKNSHWTERKRPHMQVTNVHALRRAGRRLRGFLKIARRLGALPVSSHGGKKLFKAHRRHK